MNKNTQIVKTENSYENYKEYVKKCKISNQPYNTNYADWANLKTQTKNQFTNKNTITMEQLLTNLVKAAKKDKKGLRQLKNTAVRCQQFELAAELRDIETQLFPESQESKEAKVEAQKIKTALAMVELNVSYDICWIIAQTIKVYIEKQGEFSIHDAAELLVKQKEIFFDNE
jgi:hypothetical protein